METGVKEILKGLNPEQERAVRKIEGPVLIVAGAGSGKTRVLTSRVAYMIAAGVDPSRILALTFTKKAAGEMKERIALLVGQRAARKVVMGTFHSVFIRFLREYAASMGYPEQFTIYDTSDSLSAMKACVKELELDDKVYKPKEILSRISMAKNNLITVTGYRTNQNLLIADSHAKKPRICDLYELYQKKLKAAGVMDFDDILVNMNILLRDNSEALESISDRFSHILIDEYQDTNYAQYRIVKVLSRLHHNICVVGDDSQSIYAFRGAKIENILNFRKDYPESGIFRLERNYRSTRTIVDAANSVIRHNSSRIPKECYSEADEGDKINVVKSYSEQEEAVNIVSGIMDRMRTDKAQYQDFAILYRTNAQSRAIEEQLRRRNIPYAIYSGNSFFERAEVKDMMAYFKLVVNPNDDESFKRVVNKPARGIGNTTLEQLARLAGERGCSLFKAGFEIPKVKMFCDMVNSLAADVRTADAHQLATRVADISGLYAYYKSDTSIEGLSRTSNVEELLNSVASFVEERTGEILDDISDNGNPEESGIRGAEDITVTLDDFLENVSLLSNVDTTENDEDVSNKVALMTVHSAKGLEFPYVHIAGMEENLFPSSGFSASPAEIEEERRLFYVALTRAQKAVTLSYAATRMRNGKHESNGISRFVKEIDSEFLVSPIEEDWDDNTGGWDDAGDFSGFGKRFRFGSSASGSPARYGQSGPAKSFGNPSRYGQSGPARSFGRPASGTGRGEAGASAARSPLQSVKPAIIDADFKAVPMTELKEGEIIEHNRFGRGKILSLSGIAPEMKARVDFDAYGEKLLLLKYAKLRHAK